MPSGRPCLELSETSRAVPVPGQALCWAFSQMSLHFTSQHPRARPSEGNWDFLLVSSLTFLAMLPWTVSTLQLGLPGPAQPADLTSTPRRTLCWPTPLGAGDQGSGAATRTTRCRRRAARPLTGSNTTTWQKGPWLPSQCGGQHVTGGIASPLQASSSVRKGDSGNSPGPLSNSKGALHRAPNETSPVRRARSTGSLCPGGGPGVRVSPRGGPGDRRGKRPPSRLSPHQTGSALNPDYLLCITRWRSCVINNEDRQ